MNELTVITIKVWSNTIRTGDLLNDESLHTELKAAAEVSGKIKAAAKSIIKQVRQNCPTLYASIKQEQP